MQPTGSAFEDVLVECAERLDEEGEVALVEICARHPQHAEGLRRVLAPLVEFGVVAPLAGSPRRPGAAAALREALAELTGEHATRAIDMRGWFAELQAADRLLAGSDPERRPDADPTHIGAYAVRKRVGQGAFGVVYLCAQTVPIRRDVAIKVLRPGAGDRSTLARFEAERQVLAMMSHPAVANVFDAGVLPDGRPFFVMEHVDGISITKHCDRERLGVDARIELFLALCDGVHYAHQRGIIHRDLKPSNVLVACHLGRAQPKIIDFGLAKAIHQPLDEPATLQATEAGRVLGTPGFMSPEQAQGRGADVDTRSDVFALGVLLYLMLTGDLPWQPSAMSTTPDLTPAPHRPSTKVATQGKDTGVADLRSTDRRRLVSRLRGELDWIVLKALDADRERRYPSVHDLMADLRRHLRHEPVSAGPPSAVYRLRKFVRRHRIAVLAAGAVLVSLVAGLAATWRFAVEAQTNLDRFEILALDSRLRRAKEAATVLGPNWPERLPVFERWLAEHGRPLQDELPRLRASLAELRAQALPLTAADREEDLRTNPWTKEHADQQARLDYFEALLAHPSLRQESLADARSKLVAARQQTTKDLAEAARLASERRLWRFADGGPQFLHDTMARLLGELTDFAEGPAALVARVQQARDRIVSVEIRGAEARRALWERSSAEVAADPRYGGLRLLPQAELVPLGRDPASGLQEYYHVASAPPAAAIAARDEHGRLQLAEDAGIVFVLLPGGVAWIGAQRDDPAAPCYDPEAAITEAPIHRVTLAPFFLGKHEVTQAQWLQLTFAKPSHFHDKTSTVSGAPITRRHPVENVTWDDCRQGLTRHGLDLPTEAQWEYACRAGTTTVWSTGNERETLDGFATVAREGTHHDPVGTHGANPFGLHDTVGNVAEWCRDHFSSLAYLLPSPAGDGMSSVPQMQVRVVRGGSFEDPPHQGASAARHAKPFNFRSQWLGVRAARDVQAR